MGLPIWRAPSPAGSKDAIKVDMTAPARSPIRRRGRGSTPTIAVGSRRVRRSGNAHATLSGTQRSPRLRDNDFFLSTSQLRSVDDSSDRRPPQSRTRLPPPPVPESRNYARPGYLEASAEPLFSFTDGPDTDSQPQRSIFPPYNPTSSRLGLAYDGVRRPSSIWEYGIPFFHRESTRNTSYTFGDLPTLTPNFAPAGYATFGRSFRTDSPEHQESSGATGRGHRASSGWMAHRRLAGRPEDAFIIDDGEDDSSDNNAVGFPPLQRMGRRAIADGPLPSSSLRESWSPATTLDGLGDRERSFSPIDDHWDTMLSTVAPDPIAPTADSSFTSAAASASFSASNVSSRAGSANSNSASSSNTNLTVPSRQQSREELFVRVCDTSDDDSPSDTEVEGDDPRPVNTRRPRLSSWRRTPLPTDEPLPPLRNPSRYSRSIRDRSLDSSRFVRNYYSSALRANREAELPSNDQTSPGGDTDGLSLDAELQEARAILERLVSIRGELNEEFWTSIGLTPPLAERVERLQQRERS